VPTISDGEYRHERVNVAAQRLDQNSLLNWMERAIRTRKECPEFGWGEMQFLRTDKASVLAHACTWNGRTVIALHNFSRASVSVKVDLPKGTGRKLHLFGRMLREPLPEHSQTVDLDGYDYLWLRVQPTAD
jgi:maltose alpha-D-glucosyltransferase/alpha-amylase